jgi:hypothetical protein
VRGDGRVFQRGGSWWIQFQARGQQHREPARLPDRDGVLRAAKNEAEARRAEVLGERIVGRPEKVTVKELLDDYVTHQENAGLRSTARCWARLSSPAPAVQAPAVEENVSVDEATRRMGVCAANIHRNDLPFKVRIGRRVLCSRTRLESYLKNRRG